MCGIAGIAGTGVETHMNLVQQMVKGLSFRGPDGNGIQPFEKAVLGHTRLAIVDLEGGAQPMKNSTETLAITLNGEIYGYKKIKSQLSNYSFQTNSDTEVVLALYDKYGPDMVQHLTGMFAFALYDKARGKLILARDRFGEKPLYYAFTTQGQLIFASDSRVLHQTGIANSSIDPKALAHYLQNLYVPVNASVYKNIHSLPPGHMAQFDLHTGDFHISRYWQLPVIRDQITIHDAAEQISYLLNEAVSNQLVADVPVGCFLSGGLDSTTVTALAVNHQAQLQTFAFGFKDVNSDMPYAREVASHYHTRHTELWDNTENIADIVDTICGVYDAPFADASAIPTYLISREASKHVKVALTGDGADELFAGYGYYYQPLLHYRQRSHSLSVMFSQFYRVAARMASAAGISPAAFINRRVGAELSGANHSLIQAHRQRRSYMSATHLMQLGLPPVQQTETPFHLTGTLEDALADDITNYLPGDLLVKTDRASMANGLELRTPFLDSELTAFCLSLPYRLKINDHQDKLVMRRAFSHLWPESVQKRTKSGFAPDVGAWMNRNEVKQMKADIFESEHSQIYQYLDKKEVWKMLQSSDWHAWQLLVLAVWLNKNK